MRHLLGNLFGGEAIKKRELGPCAGQPTLHFGEKCVLEHSLTASAWPLFAD